MTLQFNYKKYFPSVKKGHNAIKIMPVSYLS